MEKARVGIIIFSLLLAIISGIQVFNVKFTFDFEQFFPDGDEDLEFFKDFIEAFETDDNFLLIAIENKAGVFEQPFLEDFQEFSINARSLPHVVNVQSLTKIAYPVKTPFGIVTRPTIHIDQPDLYEKDKARILSDERFVNNLITEDADALIVLVKVVNNISLDAAKELMKALNTEIQQYNFDDYHYLGRPNFQKELVEMQQREIIVSAVVSGF